MSIQQTNWQNTICFLNCLYQILLSFRVYNLNLLFCGRICNLTFCTYKVIPSIPKRIETHLFCVCFKLFTFVSQNVSSRIYKNKTKYLRSTSALSRLGKGMTVPRVDLIYPILEAFYVENLCFSYLIPFLITLSDTVIATSIPHVRVIIIIYIYSIYLYSSTISMKLPSSFAIYSLLHHEALY